MADDLSDLTAEVRALKSDVERLKAANPLESASVTKGRVRFIGGTLRVDSGGRVEIVGTLVVDGETDITGETTLSGDLTVDSEGSINVAGPVPIRLGQANIGGGTQAAVTFGAGNGLYGFVDGTNTAIALMAGGTSLAMSDEGISLSALPAASGAGLRYLVVSPAGRLMAGASGGPYDPENPDPDDPPGDNPDGYIWPASLSYGISDDYAEHVARGSAEPGVDLMTPVGAAVYAPGPGTIVDVETGVASPMGRYVTLVTSAGDWFRFLHLSQTLVTVGQAVAQGALIARSGRSGLGSETGYASHLHITFKQGYTGTGLSLPTNDFQAYMA